MEIILFKPPASEKCAPFAWQVEFWTAAGELEVHGSVTKLVAALDDHGNGDSEKILVLLAEAREHLQELCAVRDTLSEYRSILVLPDGEAETLAAGRTLYPRFAMSFDEAPGELGAVLNRMMQNSGESARDRKPAPKQSRSENQESREARVKPKRCVHKNVAKKEKEKNHV